MTALPAPPGLAQVPAEDDFAALREEIRALREGQTAIHKELEAIRKLVQPKPRPSPVEDVDLVMNVEGAPFLGEAGAPLTLIEMTDYQCPFCARHARQVMPEIAKAYVDTGKLRYVLRDFPLSFHKDAQKAAEAAHCAGEQDRYWEMHHELFANQKALAPDQLKGYAAELGLDGAAFDECLASGRHAGRVQEGLKDGTEAGVRGTPTLFLGTAGEGGDVKVVKRLRGALPLRVFMQHIDAALAPEPAPGQPAAEAGEGADQGS